MTVLNRLFSIIQSDKVYFGEKDFQQLKIVENLIKKDFPNLKLIPVPTVRSKEGIAYLLAMQSLAKNKWMNLSHFKKMLFYSSLS